MSVRSIRRFFVTGLVVSLVMIPLSSAQAAPADRGVQSLDQRVARTLHKLLAAFRLLPQDAPNHPGSHPGNHPSSGSREGTGIDPHGKPGQGN